MANQRIPNDPYRADLDHHGLERPQRFETEAQIDPELAEGPASFGKIALYAVGIALVFGAVSYGLNHTNGQQASTAAPTRAAQTQPSAPPQGPGGIRDVTPHPNSQPGVASQPSDTAADIVHGLGDRPRGQPATGQR
jgi:hypothetical protein